MTISAFCMTLIIGLAQGMLTYLTASGLSLIRAGMGIMNFGQGAFYILGSYLCLMLNTKLPFGASLVIGFIGPALLGLVLQKLLMPVYGLGNKYSRIITMGFAYIVCDAMMLVFGNEIRTVKMPSSLTGTVKLSLFNIRLPVYYLFIIAISSLIAIAFWIMFSKTKLGIYFRAIINDHKMVGNLGINVKMLFGVMFMIGVGLSGVAGVLNAPISGLSPKNGLNVFSTVMPVVMIGGIKNIKGTLPAAITLGVVSAFAAIYIPTFYNVVPFGLMILVMLFRPNGLFTKEG